MAIATYDELEIRDLLLDFERLLSDFAASPSLLADLPRVLDLSRLLQICELCYAFIASFLNDVL
jgi:hypothetical protein